MAGVRHHVVTEHVTGAVTTTEYDNVTSDGANGSGRVYPYALRPRRTTRMLPGPSGPEYRSTIGHEWRIRHGPAGTYVVELGTVTEREEERLTPSTTWRELRNRRTQMTYDDLGNTTRVDAALVGGRRTTTTTTYLNDRSAWLVGRPTRQVVTGCASSGRCTTRVTAYGYDAAGNLTTTVVEPDRVNALLTLRTVVAYGALGTIRSVTTSDASGASRIERFTYDGDLLEPTIVTNAAGHTTRRLMHSGLGVVLERTDPNGVRTTMQYDRFGRLRATDRSDGSYEHIKHLILFGGLITMTDHSGGGQTITMLDQLGREVRRSMTGFDGREIVVDLSYDAFGRVRTESLPHRTGEVPRHHLRLRQPQPPDPPVRTGRRGGAPHVRRSRDPHDEPTRHSQLRRRVARRRRHRPVRGRPGLVELVADPV